MVTTISYNYNSDTQFTVSIGAVLGKTPTQTSRVIRLFLVGRNPIATVTVNGQALAYSQFLDTPASFTYDGKTGTPIINMGATSNTQKQTVVVTFATSESPSAMTAAISGLKGRARRTWLAKRTTDDFRVTPYSTVPGVGQLKVAGARPGMLSHLASSPSTFAQFNTAAAAFSGQITAAIAELNGKNPPVPEVVTMLSLVQLWSHTRADMLLCGSVDCLQTNSDYQVMWAEGYQPANGAAGGVAFFDYFDSGNNDNWGTTLAASPDPGYTPAIFSNGFVFAPPSGSYDASRLESAGQKCLQVWFSAANQDHMTLASTQAIKYATAKGYTVVHPCIALVNIEPEAASSEEALLRNAKAIMAAAQEKKAKVNGHHHNNKKASSLPGGSLRVSDHKAVHRATVDTKLHIPQTNTNGTPKFTGTTSPLQLAVQYITGLPN
eukprot:TRINITY_DN18403_c0_g1_i2.p1 TRINITY_DN18403_c0_g1~~TRINITY_DN18403_c0_g1_i2.p1  ORF type:complete len:436 (-),score=71.08 TRINITY_DN18403_c0_g1_i2:396-1703(-)